MRFNGYGHPDNFDITNRPSNGSLTSGMIVRFILSAALGAIVLALPYSLFTPGEPRGDIAITLIALGAILGMSVRLPVHLRNGQKKRREFIAAGGDPTGISLLQFGSMGGQVLPDGRWQWSEETISAG